MLSVPMSANQKCLLALLQGVLCFICVLLTVPAAVITFTIVIS